MQLASYLDRIGYRGPLEPTSATLRALHRAHVLAIPYENLDIHLGQRLVLDQQRIFDKIVGQRRGGWCYEMNGLFAWALREIGFPVQLLAGSVSRAALGDRAEGNHLVLLVQLERPYLVDVGFGNGLLDPLPLAAGEHRQGFLTYRLRREGERWEFENHAYGGAGFDFTLASHTLADFAAQCHMLQTDPESGFVRVTVCHRFMPDSLLSLRGAVLSTATQDGLRIHTITSAEEYVRTLREQFDLQLPATTTLWPKIWERHLAWVQQTLP
jgi:N-hydroxyarylamine O-acetyltransferase